MSNPNETAELVDVSSSNSENFNTTINSINSVEYCKSLSYHTRLNPPPLTKTVNHKPSSVCENPNEAKSPQDVINMYNSQDRYKSMFPNDESLPIYADFSEIGDYQDALNKVAKARQMFSGLDSEVRKRFDNDPSKLYERLNSSDFDIKELMTDDYYKKVYTPSKVMKERSEALSNYEYQKRYNEYLDSQKSVENKTD